ncbi:glyoxylase-like metal-dependent hydrolase (beta-lactamase superfamily II) [Actinoalloteichus hoggarensis]|uniref:Putative metallo-hydrolase YflN n=1 Tax=Actinoalloteichus hoggarensis TaxID=1470176 RepID=A0A221VXB1_9PSEU|nr:MBL fold metallo-hydrolase [Actinoalloteichus hoggarensis]ASO18189.1 putative metallo-hydrolase YflN [Actinoalloteichus hoggarensis]MBB5921546.1 glyoxylase-like metal-dependent hydrolase (beta-lactamase superfamily II) [Actinoalloteichus hoggarensis]
MKVVELLPSLHVIVFDHGQVYLWSDPDSLTLIDTGHAGSGADIASAIRGLGRQPTELKLVILTHWHPDHTGSAAEVADWHDGVTILAHRADAPVIRGERPGPPPVLLDWERPLHDRVTSGVPAAPPVRVDRELVDGELLDFAGGAAVIAVPGHTDGSIALHLPVHRALFTGDTVANVGGRTMLGVFNTDRARAAASLHLMAGLDVDLVLVGHGDPILGEGAARLRAAAAEAG